MINNSSTGKWERLRRKQQDTHFMNRLQAGMNCSPFEAKAIPNCVYDVYRPFFDGSASMSPGQICFEVVSVENSAKEKLSDCRMQTVVPTPDDGAADLLVREQESVASPSPGTYRYRGIPAGRTADGRRPRQPVTQLWRTNRNPRY